MFRTSKSSDAFEQQEAEDEPDDRPSATRGHEENSASAALRWFRRSKKADASSPGGLRAIMAEVSAAEREEMADEIGDLELANPLAPDAVDHAHNDDHEHDDSEPRDQLTHTRHTNAGVDRDESRVIVAEHALPLDFYDDGDDIDDFDDLGDLDGVALPEPPKKTSILAEIDLDDISSPEDLDDGTSLPVDLDPKAIGPREIGRVAHARNDDRTEDKVEANPLVETDKVEQREQVAPARPELDLPMAPAVAPSKHQPVMDVPLEAPSKKKGLETDGPASAIDHAPMARVDTSLALQPIPELQRDNRSVATSSGKQNSGKRNVAAPPGEDELGGDLSETLLGETVDPDTTASGEERDDIDQDMDDLRVTDLGIADLDVDPLEPDASDDLDDRSGDDWHAHLADVLGVLEDAEDDARSESETETRKARVRKLETDKLSPVRSDRSSPARPVSETLSKIALTDEADGGPARAQEDSVVPEEDDATLVPPRLLAGLTAPQKTSESQPLSPLPADTADLSPHQLSLGIIANLPRLRRFAAVQIGDETIADQLVQNTIEAALADAAALEPTSDLGLALITLSHRLRQDMLNDPAALIDAPESARAFETAVCRGLAGADQFEIRQFARAINALDEGDRELLVLVALENFSYHQIAGVLRVPIERVMTNISAARMRLRQALATDEAGLTTRSPACDMPHDQEIEINGYLDGELDGHHMADIDALVEYDEDAADRLLHYGIQGDLIRRLYAPLLNRPIPGSMLDAVSVAARPRRRGFRFGSRRALIAGAITIALCGSAIVWPYIAPTLSTVVSDAEAISQTIVVR